MSRALFWASLSFVVAFGAFDSGLHKALAVQEVSNEVAEVIPGSATEGSPEARIHLFLNAVEATREISGEDPYRTRLAHLVPIVSGAFNMQAMSSAIVGRSVWRRWTVSEQNGFASVMTEFLSATIAGRLEIETDHPTEVIETVRGPGSSQIVRTLSMQNGDAIRVDYRVVRDEEHWAIVDIVADTKISEVARRRAEFLGIIQAQGHAGIIAAIEKKIMQLDQSDA